MTIAIGRRATLSDRVGAVVCRHGIKNDAKQTVRIDYMACCIKKLDMCIAQNTDKTFLFDDSPTVDYGTPAEVKFEVSEGINGASLLVKTISGGDIIQPSPSSFQFDVTNAESGAMGIGNKFCEMSVTLSSGEQRVVGQGDFHVHDTRNYD